MHTSCVVAWKNQKVSPKVSVKLNLAQQNSRPAHYPQQKICYY